MMYADRRVSPPHQTLENQHEALLTCADQRGVRSEAWRTETSSGAKAYTEQVLGPLLDQRCSGDTFLVTDRSRLGRRLMDIMHLLHRCMAKQVTVISLKAGLECGETLNAQVLAWAFGLTVDIARNLIAARTREA